MIKRINDGGRTGELGNYIYDLSKVQSYTYAADGKLATKTDRNGNTTTYAYDIHGRLLSQTVGTLSISYTYDNNGNVLTMTDGTGTTTRTYDALNRTTSKTVPDIGTSFYVYDITAGMDAGCTGETTTDPKGNITLKVYDPVGRLSRVTADGMTSTYTYYDNGSLQTVLYGDGSREDYTFTSDNLLQTLINRKADNTIIDAYAYTYDAAHNLLSKTDSRGITSYTYDVLNRLFSVTEPSGKVTSYTYDASGNRATQTVVLGTETTVTTYTYDPLNRLLGTVTQLTDDNTMETVTTESVTYTYDNNGNQLLQTHTATIDGIPQTPIVKLTNTYDLFNQLITTVTSDGVTVISTYNGDGLRVGKSVNGTLTRYLYEYDKVVLEVNSLGDQTGRNVYGINLLTRQVGVVDTFLYMYNGHADVTALLNTAGNVVATYYYDAFGNILDQTGVLSNNILYAGYQYDTETGLYYLNARMYDPVTARFMQEDTFTGDRNDPLSLNLYTYCHNEPLMYSDPTGHTEYNDPGGYGTYYSNQAQAQQKQAEDDKNNARVGTVGTYERPAWAYPTITNVAKATAEKEFIVVSGSEYQSWLQENTNVEGLPKPSFSNFYKSLLVGPINAALYNYYSACYYLSDITHDYSGPVDPDDRFKYNFIEPAIAQLSKAKDLHKENVTWMISSTGYSEKDKKNFTRTAEDLGVKLVFFANKDELKNYINTGDIDKEEGNREKKIEAISFFAHGADGAVMLGYHQKNAVNLQIDAKDIKDIDPNAFSESSMTYFYSCNSASPDDTDNDKVFAQEWAMQTGSETFGFFGKTNYAPANYDENKDKITAAREETGYDQNGEFVWPTCGRLDNDSGPTTMIRYYYDKDGNLKSENWR